MLALALWTMSFDALTETVSRIQDAYLAYDGGDLNTFLALEGARDAAHDVWWRRAVRDGRL